MAITNYQQELQKQIEQEQYELFKNFLNDEVHQQIVQQQQQGPEDDDVAVVVDEPKEEETPIEEETEEQEEDPIIVEVNKRHGFELDYELPEGVEADSPEGIYIRDKAFENHIINQYQESFKERYAPAYKLALHLEAGGTLENFEKVEVFPEFDEVKDDLKFQERIYLRSLIEKGVDDEEERQALLNNRIKKNQLAGVVEKYLEDYKAKNEQELSKLSQQIEEQEKEVVQAHNNFSRVLTNIYNTKVFDMITIPDSKVSDSYGKFVEDITYDKDTGAFEYRVPITDENVKDLIQMKYILENKQDFFKKREAEVKASKGRVIQRQQEKIKTEQGVSRGFKVDDFK